MLFRPSPQQKTKIQVTCFILLAYAVFHLTNLTSPLMKQACCPERRNWSDFSSYSYVYVYWSVHTDVCNPHGLLLRLMSSDALVHL